MTKVAIGRAYIGQKRRLTSDEEQMQAVLLAEMPSGGVKRAQATRSIAWAWVGIGQAKKIALRRFWRVLWFFKQPGKESKWQKK